MSQRAYDFAARWRQLSGEVMAGIEAWRVQHPQATWREIAELRARMLQDVALASQAADVRAAQPQDRPVCPHCGTGVEPRGPRERQVTTRHGQTLCVRRRSGCCPACQVRLFPPR